jgi:hypothetical protein
MLILIDSRKPVETDLETIDTPFGLVSYHPFEETAVILHRKERDDPRALAYAARSLGGERVVGVIRDGGVKRPSTPTNFIEFTSNRPTTFFEEIGTGYVQQNPPFCPELHGAVKAAGAQVTGNLLILDKLPESAVQDWWQSHEVRLISTETQPEGILCRELELCYVPLALPAAISALSFIPEILAHLPAERGCDCDQNMAMAKKFGKLRGDWFENLS